jgi:hypothetical protein
LLNLDLRVRVKLLLKSLYRIIQRLHIIISKHPN